MKKRATDGTVFGWPRCPAAAWRGTPHLRVGPKHHCKAESLSQIGFLSRFASRRPAAPGRRACCGAAGGGSASGLGVAPGGVGAARGPRMMTHQGGCVRIALAWLRILPGANEALKSQRASLHGPWAAATRRTRGRAFLWWAQRGTHGAGMQEGSHLIALGLSNQGAPCALCLPKARACAPLRDAAPHWGTSCAASHRGARLYMALAQEQERNGPRPCQAAVVVTSDGKRCAGPS